MKVEIKNVLTGLMVLVLGSGAVMAANPEMVELREPEAVHVVKPVVPYEMARLGITGRVDVVFRIDENGNPHDIEVENATHYTYAESVTHALRDWRFEAPETADIKYRLPVVFN